MTRGHTLLTALRSNIAADFSSATTQPETNVSFIGHFRPVVHTILSSLRISSSPETGSPPQPETNTHFIARPYPVRFTVLPLLRMTIAADFSSVAQPETNTHFLGHFTPPAHRVLLGLRSNTANDTSTPQVQPSTPTHFIPRYRGVAHALMPAAAKDLPQADTGANPHFLGRFTAPVHLRRTFNHQPFDLDPTPAPHFVPRHQPVIFARFAPPRQNQATDVRTVEANPHFLGQFHQPQITLLRGLWQAPAADQIIVVPNQEANPHFVGRPWPVHHIVHPLLRQNSENVVSFRQVLAVANVTDEPVNVALPLDQRVFGITSSEQPG